MVVTFSKHEPFYPKSSIQGETKLSESHNWELHTPAFPQLEPLENSTHAPTTDGPQNQPLQVYSRRKLHHHKTILHPDQNQQIPVIFPEPTSAESTQGKTDPNCDSSHIQHDDIDDRPIALRKGTRSCTQHPICNSVSLEHLSPAYQAFVTRLDQVQIPSSIEIALQDPKWKAAAFEEIQALEKNNTLIITQLPPGKHTVGCSGFSQ